MNANERKWHGGKIRSSNARSNDRDDFGSNLGPIGGFKL